jgi:preprotein translocase SecE subunit
MLQVVVAIVVLLSIALFKWIPKIGGNVAAGLVAAGVVTMLLSGNFGLTHWVLAFIDGLDRMAWIMGLAIVGGIIVILVILAVKFRKKLGDFLRSTKSELGKIVWSSKENTRKSFLVVVVVAVAVAILIGLIDFAFNTGISMLDSLFDGIIK